MINQHDVGQLASLMGKNASITGAEEEEHTEPLEYLVEHLDYKYVDECKSVKELRNLLSVLKSGKEGFYPELEDAIQNRMEYLNPALKKNRLTSDEWRKLNHEVESDLEKWLIDMKIQDESLKHETDFDSTNIQPNHSCFIRGSTESQQDIVEEATIELKRKVTQPTPNPNRIKSSDYRSWDKFDVDKELEIIDTEPGTNLINTTTFGPKPHPSIPTTIPADLSTPHSDRLAITEKFKGNESFRTGDYDEALTFYTRSINLNPTPQVLLNRSATYMKLNDFESAETDATHAFQLADDTYKSKCLFRRGQARNKRGRYVEALKDFDDALAFDAADALVAQIMSDRAACEAKYRSVYGSQAQLSTSGATKSVTKKRMVIEEVEEVNQVVPDPFARAAEPPASKGTLKIVEIDDEDLDDIEFS